MSRFRSKALLAALVISLAGLGPVATASAQGLTLLKLGWTYAIGFPQGVEPLEENAGALASVHTYRIKAFGGHDWYRIQKVARYPGGGWYVPQGASEVWVNLGYALWIREITR